ncbi:lysozyme inhibitor LprI family protein [Dyella sp. C9]|uniref:lysozyme inhibitor LprI family protein n=1 Tax=Dyella sp. C9 TaxID=2202154 RepID=UPI000DEFA9E3|nr:lysozyme inhibitor LprI family protein [Dyella sp. C9]
MPHRHQGLPRLLLAGFLMTPGLAVHAQVASFDCRKATTLAERTVCATPALGRKDIAVATYYEVLLRLKPGASGMAYREFDDTIRDGQREWLQGQRDACGAELACLQRAYDERLDALRTSLDANAALTFGRSLDP